MNFKRHVPRHESEQYFRLCTNVFDGRRSRPDLATQNIVKNLRYIFLPFKIYSVKILENWDGSWVRGEWRTYVHQFTQRLDNKSHAFRNRNLKCIKYRRRFTWMRRRRRLELYNSWANWATIMSVWGSTSDVPYNIFFIKT